MRLRLLVFALALATIIASAVGGYFYYEAVRQHALSEVEREFGEGTEDLKNQLSALIAEYQREVRILVRFEELETALKNGTPEALTQATRILTHIAARRLGDVCYLMDSKGNTIASSNYNEPESFVGKNYSFRHYFLGAMEGKDSIFMGLGVTSYERGIYFGYPVMIEGNDRPAGVAVIKASVENLEQVISRDRHGIVLFVHESGLIFLSSKRGWILDTLWKLTDDQVSRIAATKQFGKGPWKWTGLEQKSASRAVDSSGEVYALHETRLEDYPSWRIIALASLASISQRISPPRLATTADGVFALVVLVSVAIVVLFILAYRDIHRRQQAEKELQGAKEDLSRTVKSLEDSLSRQRQSEASLRESEERYRNFFNTSQDCVFMTSVKGQFQDCNDVALETLGYEPSQRGELLQKNVRDFYANPEERDAHAAFVAKMGLAKEYPVDLRRKDGRVIHTLITTVVRKSLQGEIIGFQGTVKDVTDRKKAEEALKNSERRLAQIVEFLPDPTMVIDRDGRVMAWNRAMEVLTEVKASSILGKGDYEYAMPFYGIRRPVMLDLVIDFDEEIASQYRFVERDDNRLVSETFLPNFLGRGPVWLWNVAAPLYDSEGKVVGAIEVIRDITERKKSEESLLESERKYRALFEGAPLGIFQSTLDNRVLRVNSAYAQMFGYDSPQEVADKINNIADSIYVHTERRQELVDLALRTDGFVKAENQYRKKDGSLFWGQLYFRVVRDRDGKVAHLEGFVEDVTQRKVAEEALIVSERKYRTLFEESKDGVYSVLRDGKISDANEAFCKLFGYTAEGMMRKNIIELYANPSDRVKFQKEIEAKGFVKDYEVRFQKRDETAVPCLLSAAVIYARDGSIIGYRGILRDLTVRKELQRQLQQAQKMEAVGTLAGGVAHDFNNILQVTLGFSEYILDDEELPPKYRADLQRIYESARRGADLVQRLLTFSRRTEMETRSLNLNHRISDLRKMLERALPKMINIVLNLADDIATINADPIQIDQILMNLAVNARDAMPEGGKLTIETANVVLDEEYAKTHLGSKPGAHVLLTIADTGSGIDCGTLPHIFEPFYTTKDVGQGTGLGLAVVHGIVTQHGGHITCYSEPGQGTTFRIYFPAMISAEHVETFEGETLPPGGSETILLVEDEENIRHLGERILTQAGYRVLTASNGKEALEVYKRRGGEIALVILDLIMPHMGGNQCLVGLMELNPAIKVVIASGFAANGPAKDALSSVPKGFVNKPYQMGPMLEVVRKVLDAG